MSQSVYYPDTFDVVKSLTPLNEVEHAPRWLDSDGTFWASDGGDGVFKSDDYLETWEHVIDRPHFSGGMSLVTNDGTMIWGTVTDGLVYTAQPTDTEWTEQFSFAGEGYHSLAYGSDQHENIVLLSSYGPQNDDAPPQVYLSEDYGNSWDLIFEGPVLDGYHLHDVAYDPWAERIWLSSGDGSVGQQLYYSNDMGDSWDTVYPDFSTDAAIQPTCIVAGPDSVMFGSDVEPPYGIRLWKRPDDPVDDISPGDIIKDYYTFYSRRGQGHTVFRYPWYNRGDFETQSFVFGAGEPPRVVISKDGLSFWQVWRGAEGGHGTNRVTGPHPDDPQQRFFAEMEIDGEPYLLQGEFPDFNEWTFDTS